MQYINRYEVAPNKAAEFRDWLQKNRQLIADHAPDGWSYVGTYFTVLGFGSYSTETRWEIGEYGDLGTGFGDDEFQRLFREWFEFIDTSRPGETYLMKTADDVAIMEGT